ncbi:MAG: Bug family tripartite tricarboxylate transporter substrate binding protein [Usitatibacter sp.]
MKRIIAVFLLAAASAAIAEVGYPNKPLKWIVSDNPGSITDIRARQIGAKLSEGLGQPVVIENRPGGSMIIGADLAAHSAPDGYTVYMGNMVTHGLNPLLFKALPYRPEEDFIPISLISSGPLVLVVNPDLPARTVSELVALAKSQPGRISYGAIGHGSLSQLVMEQLKSETGVEFSVVPYKSTATYIQDVIAGHLPVALNYWIVVGPQVKAGKLRALAVAARHRLSAAPDVPTFAEAGYENVDGASWQGMFVPAGTPRPIVNRLHSELVRVLSMPDIKNPIVDSGSEVGGNTPDEFAAYIRADRAKWKAAIEAAGIAPQ